MLDGVDQRAYLEVTKKSAREAFFYYTGAQPSAVRHKNWKFYHTMVPDVGTGGLFGPNPSTGPRSPTFKCDLFGQIVGSDAKSLPGRFDWPAKQGLSLGLEYPADRSAAFPPKSHSSPDCSSAMCPCSNEGGPVERGGVCDGLHDATKACCIPDNAGGGPEGASYGPRY